VIALSINPVTGDGRLHPLSYDATKRPLARANRSDRRLTVREAERVQSAMKRHSPAPSPGHSGVGST